MMRQANVPPEINSEGFMFHHQAGKDHECNMSAGDILQARLQRLRSVSAPWKHEEVGRQG